MIDFFEEKNKLEHLCVDFMNAWDKCYKYPDTEEDIQKLDDVYNRMYEYIFGTKNEDK